jgi:hypothetical protein
MEHAAPFQAQYPYVLVKFQSLVNDREGSTARANDDIVELAMVQDI